MFLRQPTNLKFLVRRIDQWLANLGYCSRQQARQYLKAGRVEIAGKMAKDPSEKARAGDVLIDGQPLDHPDGLLVLINKPLGLVCSHDLREGPNVYSLLPERWRQRNPPVTSVGRLDKDTSGALLLTDQSEWVHRWTSPKHKVPKVYIADVDQTLNENLISIFASGTLMLSGETAPCAAAQLRFLDARKAELTLTEGRYHQVRRMFASQGLTVTALHRARFGSLEVKNLEFGAWRELSLDPHVVG